MDFERAAKLLSRCNSASAKATKHNFPESTRGYVSLRKATTAERKSFFQEGASAQLEIPGSNPDISGTFREISSIADRHGLQDEQATAQQLRARHAGLCSAVRSLKGRIEQYTSERDGRIEASIRDSMVEAEAEQQSLNAELEKLRAQLSSVQKEYAARERSSTPVLTEAEAAPKWDALGARLERAQLAAADASESQEALTRRLSDLTSVLQALKREQVAAPATATSAAAAPTPSTPSAAGAGDGGGDAAGGGDGSTADPVAAARAVMERERAACEAARAAMRARTRQRQQLVRSQPGLRKLALQLDQARAAVEAGRRSTACIAAQSDWLRAAAGRAVGVRAAQDGKPFACVLQLLAERGGEMRMADLRAELKAQQASSSSSKGACSTAAVLQAVYALVSKKVVFIDRERGSCVVSLLC